MTDPLTTDPYPVTTEEAFVTHVSAPVETPTQTEYVKLTLSKMRALRTRVESIKQRLDVAIEEYAKCGLTPDVEAHGLRGEFVQSSTELYKAQQSMSLAVEMASSATDQLEAL